MQSQVTNNMMTKKIVQTILLIIPIVVVATIAIFHQAPYAQLTNAQILEKDPPSMQQLSLNGTVTELGNQQRDVAIDITDGIMPANGTLSISTDGANDIDIQSMPPQGFSIIIDNQTARVTIHPVTIEVDESSDDGADGNGDDEDN